MKQVYLILLVVVCFGCNSLKQESNIFKEHIDKDEVVIILSNYGLMEIPEDIGALTKATSLQISQDSIRDGWTIYPPRSAFDYMVDQPPFKKLPHVFCNLTQLKRLTLSDLKLKELPENFSELKNLEYLDLTNDKLTIADEMLKLKRLTKLKYLKVFANKVDTLALQKWMKEKPDLKILFLKVDVTRTII